MPIIKKFMYVNRRAPYGSVYALESLEVVLIGAAFDQNISLVFMDDGVYQLMCGQQPEGIGMKKFSSAYAALGDYDIRKIYVEQESLDKRGLRIEDLMPLTWEDEDEDWAEKSSMYVVSSSELAQLMSAQDVVLTF